MELVPEDEKSYTTQNQNAFLKYVEDECCAKCRRVLVIKSKVYWAKISYPLPWLQGPVYVPLIDVICPVMMKNT